MRKTNNLAIVSLVSGVLAWFAAPVVASIVAIVTGHMARSQIRASAGMQDGDGLALAGLILGYVSLLVGAVTLVFIVLAFLGVLGVSLLGVL